MKVLVLNTGSSSVKFKLFSTKKWSVPASGMIENIFEPVSTVYFNTKNEQRIYSEKIGNHANAIGLLIKNADIASSDYCI